MKSIHLVIIGVLLSTPAHAAEEHSLSFAPSVEFGYKMLNFDVATGIGNQRITYTPEIMTLGAGFNIAYGGLYAGVGIERTLQEGVQVGVNAVSGTYDANHFKRTENTLTIGYRPWSRFNVFAGYLDTETLRYSEA